MKRTVWNKKRCKRYSALALVLTMVLCMVQPPLAVRADNETTFTFKFVVYNEEGQELNEQGEPVEIGTITGYVLDDPAPSAESYRIEVSLSDVPTEYDGRYIYSLWFDNMKDYVLANPTAMNGYEVCAELSTGMTGKLDYEINGSSVSDVWLTIDRAAAAAAAVSDNIDIVVPVSYVPVAKIVINYQECDVTPSTRTYYGILGTNEQSQPTVRFEVGLPKENELGLPSENYLKGWKTASRTLLANAASGTIQNEFDGSSWYVPTEEQITDVFETKQFEVSSLASAPLNCYPIPYNEDQSNTHNPYIGDAFYVYQYMDYMAPIVASQVAISYEGLQNGVSYHKPSSYGILASNAQQYGVFEGLSSIVIPTGHIGLPIPDGYEFVGWRAPEAMFNAIEQAGLGRVMANLSSEVTSTTNIPDGTTLTLKLPIIAGQLSPLSLVFRPVFRNMTDSTEIVGVQNNDPPAPSSMGISGSCDIYMTAGQEGSLTTGNWQVNSDGLSYVVNDPTMTFYAPTAGTYSFIKQ